MVRMYYLGPISANHEVFCQYMVWYGMVCTTLPDLLVPNLSLHTSFHYVHQQFLRGRYPFQRRAQSYLPEVCFHPLE